MDLGLQQAKVLVTAASQGLGAATARQFSREGAKVVINSRTLSKLQETAASIVEETGNPVFTYPADVSDTKSAKKLIQNAVDTLGGLDILVTNAGGPPAGTFDTFDLEAWQNATNLTLLSNVNLIREALPYLKQSPRAAILAVVSVAAKEPVPNLTLSNTIRPAVVGLMNTLSLELGEHQIRCNSILPGITETARIDKLVTARATKNQTSEDEERQRMTTSIPLGRLGQPQEFANVAVFMCSPASAFLNGVALAVDGGATRSIF